LLEASIEGARGILLNIAGGSDLGLFEVNEAAEIIHGVAHPDANIIFGAVIDDNMGDEVRVTVIAAGFERWEEGTRPAGAERDRVGSIFSGGGSGSGSGSGSGDDSEGLAGSVGVGETVDIFGESTSTDDEFDLGDDDFDVPSFLR
jgi:cell division protein FtsZ